MLMLEVLKLLSYHETTKTSLAVPCSSAAASSNDPDVSASKDNPLQELIISL